MFLKCKFIERKKLNMCNNKTVNKSTDYYMSSYAFSFTWTIKYKSYFTGDEANFLYCHEGNKGIIIISER